MQEANLFHQYNLDPSVIKAIEEEGYVTPTPVQAQTMPHVLEGHDVLVQAQTGTGKTAAFALPLLTKIDASEKKPQVLVLAPTRELAIQVADFFESYSRYQNPVHVTAIYGGQQIRTQFRALKKGVQVIVGTPGRVMDHMRRGTLDLSTISCLVLDEADEMLRMGFQEDVEWILEQTPAERQITLFSATLPRQIKEIAKRHQKNAVEVVVREKTVTAATIHQRYWEVRGLHKLDALSRILEAESYDGVIVFVKTKAATVELKTQLNERGFSAAALNGDIPQNKREETIQRLKDRKIDILVATDVAARGLDVDRISHVINYDIPFDTEAYIHRTGRTGRAGRTGEAILFVAPREKRMLRSIEHATKQKIEQLALPSAETITEKRVAEFKIEVTKTIAEGNLDFFHQLVSQMQQEGTEVELEDVAAALAKMAQKSSPLQFTKKDIPVRKIRDDDRGDRRGRERGSRFDRRDRDERPRRERSERSERPSRDRERFTDRADREVESHMDRYRIEIGHEHGVQPGNIVGAIANEAGIDAEFIGRINIHDSYSTVDLPKGMPKETYHELKKVWVSGQQMQISCLAKGQDKPSRRSERKMKPERTKGRTNRPMNGRKKRPFGTR